MVTGQVSVIKALQKERNFVLDILTFIFDMERVPLQQAKKGRIETFFSYLQDLDIYCKLCTKNEGW